QAEFRRRVAEALAKPGVRAALTRFGSAYRKSRADALAVLDYEGARGRLRAAKEDAVARLPELAAEFAANARRAGATVFEARTAEEANAYIAGLAARRGVRLAVKSKSMVSEEIELNHYLEKRGIRALEMDAGEWIIQQAGERPSHSVMPAIHLSKEEVSGIFTQALGREVPPDIPAMIGTLRAELRERFLEAGMGISGANIAVAETGTIVIVTNEGNGRLVTTAPPVHVAILGYDKILPTLEEAGHHLTLLAKTATAQGLTVYTTFITGKTGAPRFPRPPGYAGAHEPEMHIVLLDNGRWAMRDDPDFREALYCVRCASCANVCPTYRAVGGHVFGHIYTAVIGVDITPFHHGLEHAAVPQEACLLCGACVDACPAKIDLPRMILRIRERLEERDPPRGLRHFFLTRVLPKPRAFNRAVRAAGLLQRLLPGRDGSLIRNLPGPLGRLTSIRSLPVVARPPLRDRLPEVSPPRGARRARVVFFGSCLMDHLYPEIGEAVVRVLRHHGVEVRYPKRQGCCGLPAYYEGARAGAVAAARATLEALDGEGDDYVLTATPACGVALRKYFPELLAGDPARAPRAAALAARTKEFAEFCVEVLGLGAAEPAPHPDATPVTYHDSCSSYRRLKLKDHPRRLLNALPAYRLVELDEVGECCGFGGHFSADYPEVAGHVLERKLAAVERTGASVLILDSPGCLLHLRGALHKQGKLIAVRHLAELLAEALPPEEAP
ncbi:MAG: LUD domain-containing protein, partial [candidate division NC10 bacterium]|nr:LUD domain-containing protein [candidate division NC10 bacterium]